ncbi:MAG: PD-(D/E)XK nuclease family protein [Deltaproteobacteria bacterium]|nr:PD-(D/E)XK nuclease family protein [Deltaproteobacteria bacterium]
MSASPHGSARTDAWYAQWREYLALPGARWVAPAGADLAALRARLLTPDAPILCGAELCHPQRWAEAWADRRTPAAPPWLRLHVLHDVLQTTPLTYFTATRSDLATARFLLDGIEACLHAGIDPNALPRLARTFGHEREQDLAAVAQAYLSRLHRDYDSIEPAEAFAHALARVRSGAVASGPVICDLGFEPSEVLRTLLEAGTATGHDMQCVEPDRAEHAALAPVTLQRFASVWEECRAVAEQIRTRIADGLRPEQLGVVVLHPRYRGPLRQAWIEAGLQSALPAPLRLADAPLSGPLADERPWTTAPAQQSLAAWLDWLRLVLEQRGAAAQIGAALHDPAHHTFAARTAALLHEWQTLWVRWHSAQFPGADQLLTATYFRALLTATLALSPTPVPQLHLPQQVMATTLDQPWYHAVATLFLLGATDEHLPSPRPGSFFTHLPPESADPQLQRVLHAFPPAVVCAAHERDYLRLWCHNASEVIATYCETTEAGRPAQPSLLFTPSCADTDMRIDRAFVRSCARAFVSGLPSVAERVARERDLQRALHADMPPPLLNDPEVHTHIATRYREHHFSVSELEDAVECPFRSFARHYLGLRATDPDAADVAPSTFGRLLHAVLAHLYTHDLATLDAIADLTTADGAAQLDALITAALAAAAAALRPECARHHPALGALAMERIHRLVMPCVQADHARWRQLGHDAYRPAQCERSFGGDTPPVLLRDPQDPDAPPLRLQGSIDRIDLNSSDRTLLVIDYKTGRTAAPVANAIKQGQHFQLPLYCRAAEQLLPGFSARGALLFYLRHAHWLHGIVDREVHTRLFGTTRVASRVTAEQLQELLDGSVHEAMQVAQQIAHGTIRLVPHACHACDWKGVSRHEEAS